MAINHMFHPNNKLEFTHQDPNSLKKPLRGDTVCTTHKRVLGWLVDTLLNNITLPTISLAKVCVVLIDLPPSLQCTSQSHWAHLVVILLSVTLDFLDGGALFGKLHLSLSQWNGKFRLTDATPTYLRDWRHLINYLELCLTYLPEVVPPSTMWHGTHDACQ